MMEEVITTTEFIVDDNIARIDQMKPALPVEKKYQKVIRATDNTGNNSVYNLNVLADGARNTRIYEALREVTQNLIDQAARSNANKPGEAHFDGLRIAKGQRKNGQTIEEVVAFHNEDTKLAEIVHIKEPIGNPRQYFASETCRDEEEDGIVAFGTLSFINYGVVIKNANQVLAFGGSDKRKMTNQIGQHGEGLKYAIVALLRNGLGVEIWCPVLRFGRPEFQHWRFFLQQGGPTDGNLHYKMSYQEPKRVLRGRKVIHNDSHHMELRITYNKEEYTDYDCNLIEARPGGLHFDIDNYLVPRAYMRSARDSNDHGMVITDPVHRAAVFIWHFHVCSYRSAYMHWGYDLFMPVTRGRDSVQHEHLCSAITSVWNTVLETNNEDDFELILQFFKEIVLSAPSRLIEQEILSALSPRACAVLARIFRDLFGSNVYPVKTTDMQVATRLLLARFECVEIHPHAVCILFGNHDGSFLGLNELLARNTTLLIDAPAVIDPNLERIRYIFPDVVVKQAEDCYIKYAKTPGEGILVNWFHLNTFDSTERIIDHILFRILPFVYEANFDTVPIVSRLLERQQEQQQQDGDYGDDAVGDSSFVAVVVDNNNNNNEEEEEQCRQNSNKRGALGDLEEEAEDISPRLPKAPRGMVWKKVDALVSE